jgi:hypothetical protein
MNHDHARVVGGLNQDNFDGVAGCVDGTAGEGRGGMLGQGGLQFRRGPGERLRKPGPTYGFPRGERPGLDLARMLRAASAAEAKSASD